jgi:hypothetical protein
MGEGADALSVDGWEKAQTGRRGADATGNDR